MGITSPCVAWTCHSSLKLSDLVGYLNATDREPVRTNVVVDVGITTAEGEEVGVVGVVAVRTRRPIAAAEASIVGVAVVVAAAGSREKHAG